MSPGRIVRRQIDMGLPREEVVAGLEALAKAAGTEPQTVRDGEAIRMRGPQGLSIEVEPVPPERIVLPAVFPRTLVTLVGDDAAVESFYQRTVLAFLRPSG
jgi:hypothetical protein